MAASFETRGVLVIGAGGMLGRAVLRELGAREIPFAAGDAVPDAPGGIARFDLMDAADLEKIASGRWGTVINCAAWTDVDAAERDEAGATQLNGDAVGALNRACARGDATLVHFSTDYVFDGWGERPYPVDHPIAPINAYGRSKALGESLIASREGGWLIVRTSWLYAPWGKNFVRTMRDLLFARQMVRVVNDQRGRPTSAEQLAGTTLDLLAAGCEGIFHACDGGECTWFEFACEIGALTGAPARVEPCATADFPRPAARPAYSVLDLARTIERVGEPRDWREELGRVITAIGAVGAES